MRIRVIALALALGLTLTACGGRPSRRGQASFWKEAAGAEGDEILLTIGGRPQQTWQYGFWLGRVCEALQAEYESAHLTLDWAAPVDGGTLADYARDQALADTALYAQVEALAEEAGCSLTAEDEAELSALWLQRCADAGGEEALLSELARHGLDRERACALTRVGQLYRKLCALVRSGESALSPDAAALEDFARERGLLRLDRILVSGPDRDAARERAEALFARLNGAQDAGALFSALAAEGDDPAGPRTVRALDLDPSLAEAARALEPGQMSGILETAEGFSILLRLAAEEDALLDDWLDDQLQRRAEDAAVELTEAYRRIDPARFAVALQKAREDSSGT